MNATLTCNNEYDDTTIDDNSNNVNDAADAVDYDVYNDEEAVQVSHLYIRSTKIFVIFYNKLFI